MSRDNAAATCVVCGDVVVALRTIVIDDEEGVFRFTCLDCGTTNEPQMSARVRDVLRKANVPTIEDLVQSANGILHDDAAMRDVLRAFEGT
jgi:hypothetical protein